MREKVCFLMATLEGNGAEKMVTYISNKVVNTIDSEVFLILFRKKGENLDKLDLKIKIVDLNSDLNIAGILKLVLILKKISPNKIFISLGPLNAIFSLFLFLFKKSKVIARETNIPSIINKFKAKEKNIYKLIDVLYKITYKYYDLIIVQSDDMREDLEKKYKIPPNKIKKINNLVDFELINKSFNSKDKHFLELFKEKKIYGIAMGRLTEQKGFDLLIERLKEVKKINIKIFILGRGEEKENLNKKIKKYEIEEKIEILEFDSNPFKYLKKADFFLLPSRVEGFPNSLIEALGVGLPAIVNNCKGGIKEIIISGFNGEIVDFTQKDLDLEKEIIKILQYDRLKIKGDIVKRFDKKIILNEYLEEFR